MRLRIAHVLPSFEIGGQERLVLDLTRRYGELGSDVHVYAFASGPEGPLADAIRQTGAEAHSVPKGWRVDPTLVARLALRFRRARVDVVHTHNPMAMIYGAPAGKLAGAVVVHSKHGENPASRRQLLLRRAAARFTDAFVAVSDATARSAGTSRDVEPGKLRVIPNGIDLHRFGPDAAARASARREGGVPDDAFVVGTVGRLAPEKNQVALVRALASDLDERAHLVLVGGGPERDAIAAAAARLGVGPRVHLIGARDDVPRWLAAFDVFALPSLTEGLPLVVLEAMATGLPVVASRVGGIPDVVEDGRTGWLVPPGDDAALARTLRETAAAPERARAAGQLGRERARTRHALEVVAASYLDLYAELLARRARGLELAVRP